MYLQSWLRQPVLCTLLAAFTLFVLLSFNPRFYFLFDPNFFHLDEGFNLMKGMLIHKGLSLYREIWSDQPPFFSYLCAALYGIWGNNVQVYRGATLLIFLFSMGFFTVAVYRRVGLVAAVVLLLALGSPSELTEYAVIAHIAVPSVALAMLGIAWQLQSKRDVVVDIPWVLACCCFSFSMATKLWTILIAGASLLQLFLDSSPAVRMRKALASIALTSALLLFFFVESLLDDPLLLYRQLVLPYLNYSGDATYSVFVRAGQDRCVYLLGGAAIAAVLSLRQRSFVLPGVWFLLGLGALMVQSVFREHYMTLIFPAAAVLFGCTAQDFIQKLWRSPKECFSKRVSFFSAAALIGMGYSSLSYFDPRSDYPITDWRYSKLNIELFNRVEAFNDHLHLVLTDLPYVAFLLNKPTLPRMTVLSRRRINSSSVSAEELAAAVQQAKPELLWFGRFGKILGGKVIGSSRYLIFDIGEGEEVYLERELYHKLDRLGFEVPADRKFEVELNGSYSSIVK